jgi:hypothetical protein
MKKEMMNLCVFAGISFVAFLIFRNLNFNKMTFKEGMTDSSSSSDTISSSSENGIAGNAATYGANIKSQTIKLQDTLLISKYRSDYETAILNLDDLVNNLMLKTALTVDKDKPQQSLMVLSQLQQSKVALNTIMKFIDSSK